MNYSLTTNVLDWLSAFITFLVAPILFVCLLFGISSFTDTVTGNLFLGSALLVICFVMFLYYKKNFSILEKFASDTKYVHFKPSNKDLILGFYSQIFTILIAVVVILLMLFSTIQNASQIDLFLYSVGISSLLQVLLAFFINHSKIKLISTAQEPISENLLQEIIDMTPNAKRINKYYFADIKPASLFLSAGVTNYSFKSNVCLISRYFKWKLSDTELKAVIGHEIGHVVHRDLIQGKILVNLQAISRIFLIYYLFSILKNIFAISKENSLVMIIDLGTIIIIVALQLLISYSMELRKYNQEIQADEYGAALMGNFVLAKTLKKLPSVIPAPVDDDPLQFLGFRMAILNLRGKERGEEETFTRQLSRFSDN